MYPATFSFSVTIRPWPLTSNLEKQLASFPHHGDQLYQVVWSWILWFIQFSAYNIFLLCDNTPLISFSHHADQMQEVVRSWSLWFGLKSRTDRRTTLYHKTSPKRLAYKNIFFTNISDSMLCSACSIQEKIKQKIQWFIQLWNGIFTLA